MLRLKEGAPLEVCDGSGTIAAATLVGVGRNHKAYVETSQPAKTVSCLMMPVYPVEIWGCVKHCRTIQASAGAMGRAKMGDCGRVLQPQRRPRRLPHGKGR